MGIISALVKLHKNRKAIREQREKTKQAREDAKKGKLPKPSGVMVSGNEGRKNLKPKEKC